MASVRYLADIAFTCPSMPPPSRGPSRFGTPVETALRYDPSVHLQLESPEYIKTLPSLEHEKGTTVQFPVPISHTCSESAESRPPALSLDGEAVPFAGLAVRQNAYHDEINATDKCSLY